MANRRQRQPHKPAFRPRVPGPLPAGAESEAERAAVLPPALFAPRQLARLDPRNPQRRIRRRERLLPLPVLVALGVRVVWRRLGSRAEVPRG